MFAGKKSAQIREILISESAWEEMTCLFAPSLKSAVPPTNSGILCIIAAFFGNLPFFGAFALLTFEEIHMSLPHCPKCNSEYTYEDNGMYICPE